MAKKTALLGMLVALAFVLSYIETLVPVNLGIPGAKLGLANRSEEHTSELQSHLNLVCRLLLEKIECCAGK